MIYTLYLLSLIISAAVAGALAYYLWRRRFRPGARPALWMMLAVIVWSLGYVLQYTSATLSTQIFATNIQYVGIMALPVMWVVFSLQYTGHGQWLTRRNLFLLSVIPFVTVVLVWTNGIDGLMYYGRHLDTSGPFTIIAKTYGPWFWIAAANNYLLMSYGMFLLIQRLFRPPRLYREQSISLLICVIVPLAWNVVYIFDLTPLYHVDLTPSAFVISGLAITWGLFRVRLFDVIPVARDTVVEGMSDGVIILNTQNRFVDINQAAERIIGCTASKVIGQLVADALSRQRELANIIGSVTKEVQTEVTVEKDETQRYYQLHVSQLHDAHGHLVGRLVILHDISKHKQAEKALEESERHYRLLAENAKDTIWTVDMNMRPTYISPSITSLLGYSVEEAMALPMEAVYTPASFDIAMKAVAEELAIENMEQKDLSRSRTLELELNRKDGSIASVEGKFTFIRGPDGQPVEILAITRDITERKQAEKELRQSREQLRRLSAHLQSARETERTVIAREIHDELGQDLTALKMELSWLIKRLPKDKEFLLEKVEAMSKLVERTIQEVKRISTQLRPGILDDLGLVAAIEWQADEFQNRTGIRCQVSLEQEDIVVDQERATVAFRILQESLTNVARHAQATGVKVSLKHKSGELVLTVRDNGKGITEEQISSPESFGLIGMRERALFWGGEVIISGIRGKGVTVTLKVPLDKGETR